MRGPREAITNLSDYIRNKVITPVQFAITAFNSKNNSNAYLVYYSKDGYKEDILLVN